MIVSKLITWHDLEGRLNRQSCIFERFPPWDTRRRGWTWGSQRVSRIRPPQSAPTVREDDDNPQSEIIDAAALPLLGLAVPARAQEKLIRMTVGLGDVS